MAVKRLPQALFVLSLVAGCSTSGLPVVPEDEPPGQPGTSTTSTSTATSITLHPDYTTTSTSPTTTSLRPPRTTTTTATTTPTTTTTLVPSDPGRVAYVEYSPEPHFYTEVHTMNPDGSDQQQITFDGGRYLGQGEGGCEGPYDVYSRSSQPRWSPDGSQLAFMATVTLDRSEVRAVDPDGSNMRVLFDDWEGAMFSWSPDGTQIAYSTTEGVWVADADGGRARLLVDTSPIVSEPMGPTTAVFSVKWSSAGRWLAFIEATGEGCVAGDEFVGIANVETGDTVRGISAQGCNVAIDWHPISEQLLVSDCGNTGIVGTDGALLAGMPFGGYALAWSPNGTEILYNPEHPWGDSGALWFYDVATDTSHLLLEDFPGGSMEWQPIGGA